MTQLADQLVGRAEELGAFERLLEEVDGGESGALELVGEPGIGKTRLLAELAARADAGGRLVLSGSASELERDLPFSVFVDALDEYLRGLDPSSFTALDEDVRSELAHVFPSLVALAGPHGVALQHERYRTHRAVRALLEHLAREKPLVLVLDDLHWADSASVELLGALLRRPPAAAVLLALARRLRRMPERLAAAFERAQRAGTLERIELGALTPVEARELLGEGVGDADAALLYEESGGNPFYLEQLARSLDRAGRDPPSSSETSLAGIEVPPTVAASLNEELALLSKTARRVLEGAAVAGDPFEPDLAAAAAATSEPEALDGVDELLLLDLVRTTDVPRRFRFRHPLVRRAVYEEAPGAWRLGAHERCAQALAARGAPAAARAHHVQRSAREGDVEAAAVLREAGEAAARLAPASAAHWFADAIRLLPQTAVEERVDLLVARAGTLTAAGSYAESHAALLDALALVPDGSHMLRARLTRACASVESLLGRQEDARARLAGALGSLPDTLSPEGVSLMVELAVNAFWRARYEEMHEEAGRAVDAARRLGHAPLTAAALAALALAVSMTDDAEHAASAHDEAATLVDALSDDELAGQLEAAAWLAGGELYLGRYAECEAHASRGLAVARATGLGELVLVLVQTLSAAWRMRGKLAEAGELLDGGIEAARVLRNTHALVWSLSGRSSTALHAGDLELALAAAQESFDLSRDAPASFHAAEAAMGLAAASLEAGRGDRAEELLLEYTGGEEAVLIAGGPRAHCLELLARSRLALDRPAEARRAAATAATWAAAVRLPMAAVWADRALAAVELHEGHAARAAERALASAAAADDVGTPVHAALSRTLAGQALGEAGERERAVVELQRAAAELDRCGARRYREAAERELRKLGHRIHRRTRPGAIGATGLETLTERELQVARLVVDRKTNPEIATELFLSKKTVETHLRNIFRKVDVSSRIDLARVVEQADRAASGSSSEL